MLGILDDEQQALRVVRLALEVDSKLGARLVGAVKPQFRQHAMEPVISIDIPEQPKIDLLRRTHSEVTVTELIHAIKDEKSSRRWLAAGASRQISPPKAVTALIHALKDEDSSARWIAATALGKIGSPDAVPALKDKDSDVQWSAVAALGRIGSDAVSALIHTLKDKDSDVRWIAVEALGEIGSTEAVPAMIQALKDEDSGVQWTAAKALVRIANPQLISQFWQLYRSGNSEALSIISAIQECCRFYNYEIEQTVLPADSATDCATSATSISISGGNFGDIVARDKTIQVKRDYVENQGGSTSD